MTDRLDQARQEAARICAEIAGVAGGTDPFAAAVRATPMPMVLTDPRQADNPIVFVNRAFCRLTGYARDELVGRNCRFMQGPETDPVIVARIRNAIAAAEPIEVDIRNYRKSGETFWNRLLLAPVFDASGALAYFFGSQLDITSDHERLASLEGDNAALATSLSDRLQQREESEARIRFATEAGQLGIWDVDLRRLELTTSELFRVMLGFDRSHPLTFAEAKALVHADDVERVGALFDRSIRTGEVFQAECRLRNCKGVLLTIALRAQVLRADGGMPERIAGVLQDITQSRLAERRLQLSEESLRLATDVAEVGTWDLDLLTDELTWSDRTKAMFGISPNVHCSMVDFYAGLHPDDRPATSVAFASALDPVQRALYDVEYRTVGKEDGRIRWVAAKGKGLFDSSGQCVRAIGTAIDITRRRELNARLIESEAGLARTVATLDALVANAPIGFAFFDTGHRYVRVNEVYAAIVGRPMAEIVGRTLREIAPDNAVAVAPILDEVFASGRAVADQELEGLLPRQEGFRCWLTGFFPVSAEDGSVLYAGVTVVDITERRRIEAEVRELNASLETRVAERTAERDRAWNTSQDLLHVIDANGSVRAVNPAWTRILGWSTADAIGRSVLEFIHPDDQEPSRAALLQASTEGLPEFENRYRHQDGTYRWLAWVAAPENDLIYASGRHITAEKEAASRLALAQEQLRQSQKMDALGQLTGGIAHDFNNLLQVIVGNLELMKRQLPKDGERLRRLADNAKAASDKAALLTQRLLAFSRRQPLAPKPINVNALIGSMSDLLNRALGETIDLETVLAGDLALSQADPNQLESAILNLAVNAKDAIPRGGKLSIRTANTIVDGRDELAAELEPGSYVLISIADTGSGMDASTLAHAFEPFFTTKDVGKGTGLGLAMVYGFAKQSKGHATIDSRLGEGTTVNLLLPRVEVLSPQAEPSPPPPAPPGLPSETILVVEDNADVRAYTVEVLRQLGYQVIEADDGPAAIEILKSPVSVQLLFTDVVLPGGISGIELARRAAELRPALKAVFTTGYARESFANQGQADADIQLITKPFTYAELALKIRSALNRSARGL